MVVRGISGNFAGKDFDINGSLTFGRSSQGCNILFPDNVRGISRTHCKIEMSGSGAMITDLGSSYGTFVNGRKLAPYTPTPVNSGDTFWLGDKANSFSVVGDQVMQPVQMSQPNFNMPMQQSMQNNFPKKNNMPMIIGAVVAGVIVIIMAGVIINQNSMINNKEKEIENIAEDLDKAEKDKEAAERDRDVAQSEADEIRNRGPVATTVDAIDKWLGVLHK